MEVFVAVMAVIALLMLLPVCLYASYDGQVRVVLRYMFVRITLFPRGKKKTSKIEISTDEDEEEPPKKKKSSSQSQTVTDYLEWIPTLLRSLGRGAGFILRHTRVCDIVVRLQIAREDVAATAIAYGQANAGVHTALSLLQPCAQVMPPKEILIYPDFLGEKDSAYVSVLFRVALGTIIVGAILFLCGILARLMRQTLARKG